MRVLKRRMLLMLLAAVLFVSCTAGLLPAAPLAKADEITIPELHLSPKEIPESDAMQMMTQMGIGWNLEEMVTVINAPTKDKPYGRTYTVRYLGNVRGGAYPVKYLNRLFL